MSNTLSSILLMAPQGGGAQGGSMTLIMMLLIIVVFYFFMIRPQMKRQKDLRDYRNKLQKGDKVITLGGIYGKVVEVQDNAVIINVGGEVTLKIDKNGIIKDSTELGQQK